VIGDLCVDHKAVLVSLKVLHCVCDYEANISQDAAGKQIEQSDMGKSKAPASKWARAKPINNHTLKLFLLDGEAVLHACHVVVHLPL